MQILRAVVLLVSLALWGCGDRQWDTENWEFFLDARCDGTDVSTSNILCFNAGKSTADVGPACSEFCQMPTCSTKSCQCTPVKRKGPCSCSDATRTLENGC